ncbi:hypothetical protein MNBD_NITROSPINAE03-1214 [hydrothermal vent metagenome]|uniref:Uncharacterized protein n=1 Tax=hydrothermal vent metagenome TaxID=652676 RepID=A0A3B1BTJ7_9ZZZZ
MSKRADLEKSLKDEKDRYVARLREELTSSSYLNREFRDAEINRIEKDWRLN